MPIRSQPPSHRRRRAQGASFYGANAYNVRSDAILVIAFVCAEYLQSTPLRSFVARRAGADTERHHAAQALGTRLVGVGLLLCSAAGNSGRGVQARRQPAAERPFTGRPWAVRSPEWLPVPLPLSPQISFRRLGSGSSLCNSDQLLLAGQAGGPGIISGGSGGLAGSSYC